MRLSGSRAGGVAAQEAKLPATLTMTAYDTGSNGFNQAVAVGNMLKKRFGTVIRVLGELPGTSPAGS